MPSPSQPGKPSNAPPTPSQLSRPTSSPAQEDTPHVTKGFISRPLSWRVVLASPVLYGILIPLVLLDVCLTIYHWTVFPLLQIPRVQRSSYIHLDRHRLAYLPWIVKLTCTYCGYANGLLQYAVRLAGDTEAYFCPIKHQQRDGNFHHPPHHNHFAEYGDARGAQERYRHPPSQNHP